MHPKHLYKTLDKGFDTADVEIVLERFEEKVEVERLFGGSGDSGIQEGLVERPVEAVTGNLVRGSKLLDQQERLNAGVEVGRVRDTK